MYSPFGHPSGNKFLGRIDDILKRRNVDLRCDFPSEAKGNCFTYAVCQQLHLPNILSLLSDEGKELSNNCQNLRQAIVDFVQYIRPESPYYAKINHSRMTYIELHPTFHILKHFSAWDMRLQKMRRSTEWFDEQFMQFTAFFLNLDIMCVTRTETMKFCSDPSNEGTLRPDVECNCPGKLYIANLDNVHFQSLLPWSEDTSSKPAEFTCQYCNAKYNCQKNLTRHVKSSHSQQSFTCMECDKSFDRLDRLSRHTKTEHLTPSTERFPCDYCGAKYTRKDRLIRHLKATHSEQAFPCNKCSQSFARRDLLVRHMNTDHLTDSSQQFPCDSCGAKYTRKDRLIRHLKATHSEQAFPCNKCSGSCGVKYNRKDRLTRHIKVHSEQLFHCNECSKASPRKDSLSSHIKTHLRKTLSCNKCDAVYYQTKDLLHHVKIVHSNQSSSASTINNTNNDNCYTCPYCVNNYSTEGQLFHHIRKHEELHTKTSHASKAQRALSNKLKRMFRCEDCYTDFTTKSDLQRHIRSKHQSGNVFKCSLCKEVFNYKTHLTRHVKEKHRSMPRKKPTCYEKFFAECKYGAIFNCISCHTKNYYHSVDVFDAKLEEAIRDKFETPDIMDALIAKSHYIDVDNHNNQQLIHLHVDKDGDGNKLFYICKYCKEKLTKGTIPPTCILNGCETAKQPAELKYMKEVEVSLIAQNLHFIKMFRLPKTRWTQMRDRVINVPVPVGRIQATIQALPRNPSNSGLIGIKFKRKKSYKNTHKHQLVDVQRLIKGLQYLIDNHSSYQGSTIDFNFMERCKQEDPHGYEFFIEDNGNENTDETSDNAENTRRLGHNSEPLDDLDKDEDIFRNYQSDENDISSGSDNEMDVQDKAYDEYIKEDPVRRHQFNYDENVAMANDYPEAEVDGNVITQKSPTNSNIHNYASVAPGEGQIPTSVLRDKRWDINTYPNLFPDGKNGLHEKRPYANTSHQMYFKQRLFNVDQRYAKDPGYLYSSTWFIEKKQLERNIYMSYNYGKQSIGGENSRQYKVDNPFHVFQKIKNTPNYWSQRKMEFISKLENKGPFQIFFTLSCADTRWDENFTSQLRDLGVKISYEKDADTDEIMVFVTINNETLTLSDYLKDSRFCNDSRHEQIRKNVLNATRNFDHRVKMFFKHILMSKDNPMNPQYFNYRVEFQMRGAGHIHGVIWVDLDKSLPNGIDNKAVKSAFAKFKKQQLLTNEEEDNIIRFVDSFITCTTDSEEVKKMLIRDCKDKNKIAEKVISNAKEVNMHSQKHSMSCRKYRTKCRFSFPKYPSLRTIITKPPDLVYKERLDALYSEEDVEGRKKYLETKMKINTEILRLVQITLDNYDKLEAEEPQLLHMQGSTLEAALNEMLMTESIKKLVDVEEELIDRYHEALETSTGSRYTVVLKRHPRDRYVNNYNPEWLFAWNANLDLQVCLDFYSIVTYISDYYSKDDTGTVEFLKKAYKEMENKDMVDQLKEMANTFLTHRKIGEAESLYRLIPSMHLSDSNLKCVYVATGFPKDRYAMAQMVTMDEKDPKFVNDEAAFQIDGRRGLYKEKPSLLSKYQRRKTENHVDKLCYLQFCQYYEASTRKSQKSKQDKDDIIRDNDDEEDDTSDYEGDDDLLQDNNVSFKDQIHTSDDNTMYPLPDMINLRPVMPGEPPFMRRKRSANAVRIHKVKDKASHEWLYSQILLYRPFKSEEVDLKTAREDVDICKKEFVYPVDCELVEDNVEEIHNSNIIKVRRKVMPFIEDIEEAREKVTEVSYEQNRQVGAEMDPQNENDDDQCRELGEEEHPDYEAIHPDNFVANDDNPPTSTVRSYKHVDLWDKDELYLKTRQLNEEQRYIVDEYILYARNLRKAFNGFIPFPKPPLMVVEGDAGTGKSTLIKVLSQWFENEMRCAGDNPDYPYLLKGCFTGDASTIIDGQTLHSLFRLGFQNKIGSLRDKSRDKMREQLQHLSLVIMDEYSMIKSDMLYQIDARLKEIKNRPNEVFGGIAILILGNMLQLKPVKARYIFETPISDRWITGHILRPLWKLFSPVLLVKNHRQGEDLMYAELLRRAARGNMSQADITLLNTRVFPSDHPDVPKDATKDTIYSFPKHVENNKYNTDNLNKLDGCLYTFKAKHMMATRKKHKPNIDKDTGLIRNTPLLETLQLKPNARVMLTYNIDNVDGLVNGRRGAVLDFISYRDEVRCMIVEFDDDQCGKERRTKFLETDPETAGKYPNGTPIWKLEFAYSCSRKDYEEGQKAKAVQFPLRLAYSVTMHKMQGQTIYKPGKLVTCFKSIFQAAMGYVTLGRVTAIDQIYILDKLYPEKIYPSTVALQALEDLEARSLNKSNIERSLDTISIAFVNAQNLIHHSQDVNSDHNLKRNDLILLGETWIPNNVSREEVSLYSLENYTTSHCNVGPGKGLIGYSSEMFHLVSSISKPTYQMLKYALDILHKTKQMLRCDVIGLYRSGNNGNVEYFLNDLMSMIDTTRICIILGDFNICLRKSPTNRITSTLLQHHFRSLVDFPTHVHGGKIDHMYLHVPDLYSFVDIKYHLFSPYYTDHYGISILLQNLD